jgi:nitric oxide dioxygenase
MKPESVQIIKSTLPVLQQHGEDLTRLFYQRMFENNPEVKPYFNQAHQQIGSQQRALASAICAYAQHIDNPQALAGAVELIAQKHASLGIKAEHYPIVGANLLASIRELLGDAATEDIIEAWAEAYMALADIFINREQAIYEHHEEQYGWQGFKPFVVVKREFNSDNISSFYLLPQDGEKLPSHKPGQYITVRVPVAEGRYTMRNYSLSNEPGSATYRISVKRELPSQADSPAGVVSNFLHEHIQQGDLIEIAPPCGDFTLKTPDNDTTAQVFIAGGIGITPLLSMLHEALNKANGKRQIILIQTAINGDVHAFEDEIALLADKHINMQWHVRYSEPTAADTAANRYDSEGLLDMNLVETLVGKQDADYYLCGPKAMLKHTYQLLQQRQVPASSIHYELFGPADQLSN